MLIIIIVELGRWLLHKNGIFLSNSKNYLNTEEHSFVVLFIYIRKKNITLP